MSYRIRWADGALADIEAIYDFIAQFDEAAAFRLAGRIHAAGMSLVDYPRRARAVADGVHDLSVVWPYVIRYSIDDDLVVIRRIRHGARQPD